MALPNDLDKDVWPYYELLWINSKVFDDHLVVILQVPVVDESLVMNMFKVYNLPILHPALQKNFQYTIEDKYIGISSDSDYATLLSECDMFTCAFNKGHMCQFDTA